MPAIADPIGSVLSALGAALEWLRDAVGDAIAWLVDAGDWLGSLLAPAGEILARLWPPVLAAFAMIALLRTVRWLLLLWRGRAPRVQISTFAWTASDKEDREATWVTSLFREQLATLRLDALDPLPDRAPGAPLVEIVEGVGQGVGRSLDIGKAVGKLFRAVWPDAAYEVWGTLRPRQDGGGRISVQLVDRRGGNRTLLNVALAEASWEEGAREAAMAVAGALYPQVRMRDRGPWTMWKEAVPRELMADYHAGREYEEANRLEHALDRYHAALDRDPLNPNLRLKIAMLQERLELDLDAWVTYEAIVDESDPRAWRGPDRRIYLLAHYRLAILLGNGRVATQWVKNDSLEKGQETRHDKERGKCRRDLMMSLERNPLLTRTKSHPSTSRPVIASSDGLISELRSAGDEEEGECATLKPFKTPPTGEFAYQRQKRARLIDAVLQIVSLRHLEELDAWLRIRPPRRPRQWRDWWVHRPSVRRWLNRREFARSAVRVSKLLVRVRIAASLERRYLDPPNHGRTGISKMHQAETHKERIRKAHRQLTRRWPFPPVGAWRHTTHFLAPRRRWTNRRDDAWQLHYNAACAAASVLRMDSVLSNAEQEPKPKEQQKKEGMHALPGKTNRAKVIARTIGELEEYAHRAGSERVAAQADWLAIDDPDLEGLRNEPEFRLWAGHHLPRELPPEQPSRKSDVKRFTVRVIHQGARAFADSWRKRADGRGTSAVEIASWWHEERRAWETLRTSCREHLSWKERLKGLQALRAWLDTTERQDLVDFGHESRGDPAAAETLTDDLFDRLVELAGNRRAPPAADSGSSDQKPTVLPWVHGRAEWTRAAYEKGERQASTLLADVEREEALRAFRIWTRLADALAAELRRPNPDGDVPDLDVRLNLVRKHLPKDADRRDVASDRTEARS